MAKTANNTSKKYLKILGICYYVLGALFIILGIFLAVNQSISLNDLNLNSLDNIRQHMDDNGIRILLGSVIAFSGLWEIIIGWLLHRAVKNPAKSVLVLVLATLNAISNAYQLFTNQLGSAAGSAAGGILSLTISILTVLAILKIRQEIDA